MISSRSMILVATHRDFTDRLLLSFFQLKEYYSACDDITENGTLGFPKTNFDPCQHSVILRLSTNPACACDCIQNARIRQFLDSHSGHRRCFIVDPRIMQRDNCLQIRGIFTPIPLLIWIMLPSRGLSPVVVEVP